MFNDKKTSKTVTIGGYELDRWKKDSEDNFSLDPIEGSHYICVKVDIVGKVNFIPAKIYAPPEDCYEEELDVEIEKVTGPNKESWIDKLTKSEKNDIEELMCDSVIDELQEEDEDDNYERD